jgi:hypothetical protein
MEVNRGINEHLLNTNATFDDKNSFMKSTSVAGGSRIFMDFRYIKFVLIVLYIGPIQL